jgi:hypothetical protein
MMTTYKLALVPPSGSQSPTHKTYLLVQLELIDIDPAACKHWAQTLVTNPATYVFSPLCVADPLAKNSASI